MLHSKEKELLHQKKREISAKDDLANSSWSKKEDKLERIDSAELFCKLADEVEFDKKNDILTFTPTKQHPIDTHTASGVQDLQQGLVKNRNRN